MSDSSADLAGGYDIVILGGGSGGYACALRAAELGKRVALIEEDKVGGTCLHRGCIPTKALLHAAEVADLAHDGPNFGVLSVLDGIDMAGVNAYKDKVVTRLWKGLTGLVESRKIDVIQGHGRLDLTHLGPGWRPGHYWRAHCARHRFTDAEPARPGPGRSARSSPAITRCSLIMSRRPRSSSAAA